MRDYIDFIISSIYDFVSMLFSWYIFGNVSVGGIILVSILSCIVLGGLLNVVGH